MVFSSVVVQYLETGGGEEEQMSDLQSEKYTQEILRAVFSGMHSVLTAALRQPGLKAEVGSKHGLCLLNVMLLINTFVSTHRYSRTIYSSSSKFIVE